MSDISAPRQPRSIPEANVGLHVSAGRLIGVFEEYRKADSSEDGGGYCLTLGVKGEGVYCFVEAYLTPEGEPNFHAWLQRKDGSVVEYTPNVSWKKTAPLDFVLFPLDDRSTFWRMLSAARDGVSGDIAKADDLIAAARKIRAYHASAQAAPILVNAPDVWQRFVEEYE